MNKRPHKHSPRHGSSHTTAFEKRTSPLAQPARPPLHSENQSSKKSPSKPATNPTDWSEVASWYDTLVGDDGSEFHREVIIPGILRLLSDKDDAKKLRVLDLACGQGVLCRKLASLGHTVTGLDAAEPLIAAAKKRNDADALPINYLVADATKLVDDSGKKLSAGLPLAQFDAVTLVLAIQNMTPLSPIWHACKLALKPGGKLLLVMMHPCFRIPKQSDWLWEANINDGTQARIIRQYLSSEKIAIQTHPGLAAHGKNSSTTTHFHRPLQAYINTLANAGLLIDHFDEWPSHKTSQPGPKKEALDRARKEIPMFLALRAKRI